LVGELLSTTGHDHVAFAAGPRELRQVLNRLLGPRPTSRGPPTHVGGSGGRAPRAPSAASRRSGLPTKSRKSIQVHLRTDERRGFDYNDRRSMRALGAWFLAGLTLALALTPVCRALAHRLGGAPNVRNRGPPGGGDRRPAAPVAAAPGRHPHRRSRPRRRRAVAQGV